MFKSWNDYQWKYNPTVCKYSSRHYWWIQQSKAADNLWTLGFPQKLMSKSTYFYLFLKRVKWTLMLQCCLCFQIFLSLSLEISPTFVVVNIRNRYTKFWSIKSNDNTNITCFFRLFFFLKIPLSLLISIINKTSSFEFSHYKGKVLPIKGIGGKSRMRDEN